MTAEHTINFKKYHSILNTFIPYSLEGKVNKVVGLTVEGKGPPVSVGELCTIKLEGSENEKQAEVIGFRGNNTILMPLSDNLGIAVGLPIIATRKRPMVKVGNEMIGRVLNGIGETIDDKGNFTIEAEYPIYNDVISPLKKNFITTPIDLGVRALNGLLTCGRGQRIGIFSGTGVGKSVLLGMISKYTSAEVTVIALIGERGREVKEFIERNLGSEGMKKCVVVVATSDQPPLVRMRGAFTATAIAEYFRDQGKDVLLLMDSVTRFAMAQREIGLAAGEPPTTKGYTPSVFTLLPRLLERAGTTQHTGTITGIYTVLVEGDDLNEPISDAVRSIIDGHIILSRDIASRGHYPAIDVLKSISRVMTDIVPPEHILLVRKLFETLAVYREAEDLINIGAYVKGSNEKIDFAISMLEQINNYLTQNINEPVSFEESVEQLYQLFSE